MFLHIDVVDGVAFVPGWVFCVALGVVIGWMRARAFK